MANLLPNVNGDVFLVAQAMVYQAFAGLDEMARGAVPMRVAVFITDASAWLFQAVDGVQAGVLAGPFHWISTHVVGAVQAASRAAGPGLAWVFISTRDVGIPTIVPILRVILNAVNSHGVTGTLHIGAIQAYGMSVTIFERIETSYGRSYTLVGLAIVINVAIYLMAHCTVRIARAAVAMAAFAIAASRAMVVMMGPLARASLWVLFAICHAAEVFAKVLLRLIVVVEVIALLYALSAHDHFE